MSLKVELEQWLLATKAFDDKDYEASLDLFEGIADSAKILFNIGVILGAMDDHESAIHAYVSALQLDQYFAIAYFQKGVSNMILKDFHAAFDDFNDALLYLRGNLYIDYSQLGLTFKLYSCEVLYNRALCYFELSEDALGMNDLLAAQKEKQIVEHRIVDRAIDNKGKDCPFYSLPTGMLYRPCENKIKNSKKVDYLGNSKLIAAVEDGDTFTGFKGAMVRRATNNSTTSPVPVSRAGFGKPLSAPAFSPRNVTNPYANNQFSRNAVGKDSRYRNLPKAFASVKSNATGGGLVRRATSSDNITNSPGGNTRAAERFRQQYGLLRSNSEVGNSGAAEVPKLDIYSAMEMSHPINTAPARAGNWDGFESSSPSSKVPSPSSSFGSSEDSMSILSSKSVRIPKGLLKVKCHHHDTRVLLVHIDISFNELTSRIQEKFEILKPVKLKYRDEDDELVLMTDQEDMEMARSWLNDTPEEGPGDRLEVWCFE